MNAFFPRTQVFLVFLNGPLANRRHLINKPEMLIGSSPNNDIVIPDPSILPRHTVLYFDKGNFFLRNLDSQGIVEVNQHPVPIDQWVPVDYDQRISLGQLRITFYLDGSNSVPVPPTPPPDLSTGPQAAMPYTHAQFQQTGFLGVGSAQAPTETTRYLCMGARIDQSFRDYVFKHIVREKHRAVGESHGVDIPVVVKSSYTAQHQVFIRDVILCGLLVILLFQFIISPIFTFNVLHNVNSLQLIAFPLSVIGSVLQTLVSLAWTMLFVLLARNKNIPEPIRAIILLIAFLIFLLSFNFLLLILLYLAAWAVIVWHSWETYYGVETQQLAKGKFNPGNIHFPLDPQVELELRRLSDPDQNVIVYSGYSPFVGSGIDIDGWSFPIDTTKGKKKAGGTLTPEPFLVEELYECVHKAIHALDLSNLNISDKLYVNGKAISNNPNFFDNTRKRPITRLENKLVKQWTETFSEDVRYYKCFRVLSWKGELIISIYIRFMKIEKNLFVEANYVILPPLKEEFYLLDTLEPTFTLEKLWNLAKLSFFSAFPLWILSPFRVIPYLANDWSARREQEQVERLIANNPAFDYGTSTSLREVASSSNYRLHFQRLDKEMYVKTIERQLLESIINFLDSKNIDTTDLKERQETILNHGVIVSGGTIESLAFGEKAKATSNRFAEPASNAGGTRPQQTSQN